MRSISPVIKNTVNCGIISSIIYVGFSAYADNVVPTQQQAIKSEVLMISEGSIKLLKLALPMNLQSVNKTENGSTNLNPQEASDARLTEEISVFKLKAFKLSFPVFKGPDQGYYVLMTPPLGVPPGPVTAQVFEGKQKIKDLEFQVEARNNTETSEVLDAPELDVLPKDNKVVARVAQEDTDQKAIFKNVSPERLWTTPFVKPLEAPISSEFGIYRMYSKHLRRRTHWGTDFKTPVGTKVKATSDGVVVLARDLFFPGLTIIIDHGQGLYTGYSHLSKMDVKVGDRVSSGQIIGKSGRSGKLTGPHLHWFAVNSRVKFDPMKLLELNFEDTEKKITYGW